MMGDFESDFEKVTLFTSATKSYISYELQRFIEIKNRYILSNPSAQGV